MSKSPETAMYLEVNGHELSGEKRHGKGWVFRCHSWPEIERRYLGAPGFADAVEEFMRRALATAVTVKVFAKGGAT